MGSRRYRRTRLFLAGLIMGLLGVLLGLWFYLQAGRIEEVRTNIGQRLQIARDAIVRVEIVSADAVRIHLRGVSLTTDGDTILTAPRVALTLDATTLEGTGPIEFYDIDIVRPSLRAVQSPSGEWNYLQPFELSAAGEPVRTKNGRALVFRDISIDEGRLLLAFPGPAPANGESAFPVNLPVRVIGGVTYHEYQIAGIEALLPLVRVGGTEGWRVEIGEFSGLMATPELAITELRGAAEQEGEYEVRLDVAALRIGDSLFSGGGLISYLDEGVLYDVSIDAERLVLADLQPLLPALGDEGEATFSLDIESLTPERVVFAFSDLDFSAYDSRILGSIALAAGGALAPALLDANLELAPLRLQSLLQLGLLTDLPVRGEVTGLVSTRGLASGLAAVDLRANLVASGQPTVVPSVLLATGTIAVGDAFDAFRLDGVTVAFRPLYLQTLVDVFPDLADRLQGRVEGTLDLAGTFTDMQFSEGILAFDPGEAPTSTFTSLSGRLTLDPLLSYSVSATAQSLALATLTELFPALPFRAATVAGPIEIAGDADGVTVTADLEGSAGGVRFTGGFLFGGPLAFEVSGELSAFAADMILRPEVPVEGPVTGTFAVSGSTDRFDFDVDLTQDEGRAILAGSVTLTVDPPIFDVAGDVTNFRIGVLVGDPQLFPDPMTGTIALVGGGGQAYRFDVDLTGDIGRLDLAGTYLPGTVPIYQASGFVAGLDLSRLPVTTDLPPSSITGTVEIDGRGTDLESLAGYFAFDATASTVSGMSLDTALGRLVISGGVMQVDTLHLQLQETTLIASGMWGLEAPAPEPLRYSLQSPDLRVVGRLFGPTEVETPQLAGSVVASGTVGGSVEYPVIVSTVSGRNFRYEQYSAGVIDAEIDARRTPGTGWQGEIALSGEDIYTPQLQYVETLALEASGTEESLAFSLAGRRDAMTDLVASGTLALDAGTPTFVALEAMTLRAEGSTWVLVNPTVLRFTEDEGLLVENLVLQRAEPETGLLVVNGIIPPEGEADLQVSATEVRLADLSIVAPQLADFEGNLSIDADITGQIGAPQVAIQARITDFAYEGGRADLITFQGLLAGDLLTGSAEATVGGRVLATAEVQIPMDLSLADYAPSFELLTTEPASIFVVADSVPFDLMTALIPGISNGVGVAEAQIDMSGTLDQPILAGWIRLADGAITVDSLNVRYTGIQADMELSRNQILINSLSARSGGTMTASGSIDFPAGDTPRYAVNVTMSDFRVMNDPDLADLTASAQLALNGPVTDPVLTGWVDVNQSTLQVPELVRQGPALELAYLDFGQIAPLPEQQITPPIPVLGNLRIDGVEVSVSESVWLESDEMRIQIAGDLVLFRSGDDLRVFGALEAVRGTYTLDVGGILRDFDVISGRVQFFGTGDLNPSLDIVAGYQVRGGGVRTASDLTVLVRLGGTLLSPTIELGSDAPVALSENDLLSYLLFGQASFEDAATSGQFLSREITNILTLQLQRPILQSGICDWVRVRPGTTRSWISFEAGIFTNAVIQCGRELADEVFLTVEAGLGFLADNRFDGRVGVEWQIDNQWQLEAAYGSVPRSALTRFFDIGLDTQFSTEIRRQWEYGRPRRETIDLLEVTETEAAQ